MIIYKVYIRRTVHTTSSDLENLKLWVHNIATPVDKGTESVVG